MNMTFGRVGILGGGQLSLMLTSAARKLGLDVIVFAESLEVPAATEANQVVVGDFSDRTALRKFFEVVQEDPSNASVKKSVIAFENEFLNCDVLQSVCEGLNDGLKHERPICFLPELSVIRRFQKKIQQKNFLIEIQLPTADYLCYSGLGSVDDWVREVVKNFNGRCVFKWDQMGYDGKGVFLFKDNLGKTLEQMKALAVQFCERACQKKIMVFAERAIDFRRELAVVACRSEDGSLIWYPIVVSEQQGGICKKVFGPAMKLGLGEVQINKIETWAKVIGEKGNLVGSFALELFELDSGEIFINEIAPRVHNSGHYTLDAAQTSQFENHWRALLGVPLRGTKSDSYFGMYNLVGLSDYSEVGKTALKNFFSSIQSPLKLYWYGKKDFRKGRKMGHINIAAKEDETFEQMMTQMGKCELAWEKLNGRHEKSIDKTEKFDP